MATSDNERLEQAHYQIQKGLKLLHDVEKSSRSISIAKTKAEEALLWLDNFAYNENDAAS